MKVLPVVSSIISAAHIAVFVKEQYGLTGNTTARILKTGISHTYLVTDGAQQYIFRVYSLNWRTEKEIAEEIRLLGMLKESGVAVSYPLADTSAEFIQHLQAPEGLRFAVMFSFAKGIKMLNFPADLHYKAGQMMAAMHKVTHNLSLERVTYTPEVLLMQSFERLQQFLPADTEEMQYMKSLQTYLFETLNTADEKGLRTGAVHLDIWFDNMSIDGSEVTIFDFDFCGNGFLVLDIAYYILQLFSTERDEKEFNLKKESFLQGYESVTTIPATEKELLPVAAVSLYFFYLGVQCKRYDDWSNNFLNEIYLKRFINLLIKRWADFHKLVQPVES